MEFLNINGIKLKVTLSQEECLKYGIDTEKSDFSDIATRRAVRSILSEAEEKCGFFAEGERILVQKCPLPDGRCELFVTRLVSSTVRERAALIEADGVSLIEKKTSVYRFYNGEDLKKGISLVYREGISSDLYRDDLGRYYILIREEINDGISELELLVEFAQRLPSLPVAVLSEYGTLIAKENAMDYINSHSIADFDNLN